MAGAASRDDDVVAIDPDAWLVDAPEDGSAPIASLLFAHGSSAAMDSQGLERLAGSIAANGLRVVRFEFPYMAGRRTTGRRPPPPRAEKLMPFYVATLAAAAERFSDAPLVVGGKSLGGRVATLIADDAFANGRIIGTVVVGYPFHPPGAPEKLRTGHLVDMTCPVLICQGSRDPFGGADEVADFGLSPAIEVRWFADGDHDLKPRVKSGETWRGHIEGVGATVGDLGPQAGLTRPAPVRRGLRQSEPDLAK